MRTFFLAMIVAVLANSAALADPLSRPKPDYRKPPGRLPPARSATANPCAPFGPGFVKVEGSDTCVKIGGAISADVGSGFGH